MKKLIAILLAGMLLLTAGFAALAEKEKDYGERYPDSLMFDSFWITEDSDWLAECDAEDDGFKVMITHNLEDGNKTVWEYTAVFSGESMTLNAGPFGMKYTKDENDSSMSVNEYEDGNAMFLINDEGRLVWQDEKEDAGKGLTFIKIGRYLNTQWIRGNREVVIWAWYDGEYDIRVYDTTDEEKQIVQEGILKGAYNPENDTIAASGSIGEDGENINVVFSFNERWNLVWTGDDGSEPVEFEVDYSPRG